MESSTKPYIGLTVLFCTETDIGGTKYKHEYPGTIYKLYPDEAGDPVGLCAFVEGIPTRYGKVVRSNEFRNLCWMELKKP